MTKKEFMVISTALIAAYPNSKIMGDTPALEFWYKMLQDIDYSIAENAAMEYISTSPYPPSIAEIRRLCVNRVCKGPLSFDEAWGQVQKAISTYGWEHPQEAYAVMDDITVSVVKNLGWNNICKGENPDATRANFREAYEEKAKKAKSDMQMPRFVEQRRTQLISQFIPEEDRLGQKEMPALPQEERPEFKSSSPEYIEKLMKEHGLRR